MLFVEMWIDCITVHFWQIKKGKIQFPTFINFSIYKTVYIFACLLGYINILAFTPIIAIAWSSFGLVLGQQCFDQK